MGAWHEAKDAPTARPSRPLPGTDESAASREERLFRQGHKASVLAQYGEYSKAAATIASDNAVAPATPETIAALEDLHPDEHGYNGIDWDESYLREIRAISATTPFTISAADVCKAIAESPLKSAGGPSGLRTSHLRDAILGSPEIATALAGLLERFANGAGDSDEMSTLLGSCRLIPLRKASGGLRPIAIGEIIRRLGSRICLRQRANATRAAFEPLQVGVGTSNGGVAVYHSASAYYALNPGKVLINIDLKNAFNSMSRVAMLEGLRKHDKLKDLIPFLRHFYLRKGILIVQNNANGHIVFSRTTAWFATGLLQLRHHALGRRLAGRARGFPAAHRLLRLLRRRWLFRP